MKRLFGRLFLLFIVLLPLSWEASSPYKADSFDGIAQPYRFSILGWESRVLFNQLVYQIKGIFRSPGVSPEEQLKLVTEYFRLGEEISRLEGQVSRAMIAPGTESMGDIEARLKALQGERVGYADQVEAILERQIRSVLAEEDISFFPPVDFKFSALPNIFVISPRNKIELLETALLVPNLKVGEVKKVEGSAEKLDYSALVEGVGGVATYPSLVPETSPLKQTLVDAAHEWLHHYLFFQPLGRRYGSSYQMTTINETVASLAGKEIGLRVYRRYYDGDVPQEQVAKGSPFDSEMRQIRLAVEKYLVEGKIEEAERFMEESRRALARKGYYIRKLNQAYFAFHGSYADTPASISPVGEMLKNLREGSPSLGEFLRKVSGITSYADLEKLVKSTVH